MTSPRTPRQWAEGSEEPPADVTRLRGASGEDDVVRCGTGWWIVAPGEDPVVPDSFADGFRWRAGASIPTRLWPLSEVLPETPEPPQAQTDRDQLHQNVRFAIADPGHFLPRKADEPVSHWSARAVMDVLGMLDMLGAPGQGYTVLTSQSVPAVPVSSTGGKETGEGDEDAQGADEPDYVTVPVTPQYVATRGIANIIDEHFGDDYEAAAWAAAEEIVRQGYAYPRLTSPISREELGRRVSEVALKWSREQDDRPGATATWEQLADEFQELHMRVGEAMFGLGMTFSPAPRSLPDSETEVQWSVREQGDERFYYHPTTDEEVSALEALSAALDVVFEATDPRRATSGRAIPEPTEGQNP